MRKTMLHTTYQPNYAVPPGTTLSHTLETLGLTFQDVAQRTDMPLHNVQQLAAGRLELTSDIAHQLEVVTGVPSSLWLNLELQYRQKLMALGNHASTNPHA